MVQAAAVVVAAAVTEEIEETEVVEVSGESFSNQTL